MADSIAAYAQPLLDEADGSPEQISTALTTAQLCWNLSSLSEKDMEQSIAEMRPALGMDEAEFADFLQETIVPMILRCYAMFPNMPGLASPPLASLPHEKKYPGTGRNDPCPCNSGKKYKRCCGK